MQRFIGRIGIPGFIVLHCLIWWAMIIAAKPYLDNYADMIEVFGWSQHWLMGSNKHPQFLPWVTKLWFAGMPQAVWSFYLLAAVNLGVGLFGIAAFGRKAGLNRDQLWLAIMLQVLAFPYLTLPDKLNMNAILISVWPWVAWAYLGIVQARTGKRLVWAALCGVLLACAILSKYYSVILLPGFFIASCLPNTRAVWRSAAIPVALGVMFLCLLPHLLWLRSHSGALEYIGSQGDGAGVVWSEMAIFFASPVLYWCIPLGIFAVIARRNGPLGQVAPLLWVLALSPWAFTLVAGLTGGVELSLPWSIPTGFAYTLLMAAMLRPDAAARASQHMRGAFFFIWPAMIVLGLVFNWVNAQQGDAWHYTPNAEAAIATHNLIQQSYPDLDPAWVAGGKVAASYAFFSGDDIDPLAALPDRLPGFVPPHPWWRTEAGIILCGLFQTDGAWAACHRGAALWAAEHGLQSVGYHTTVRRSGWRFPKDVPYITAFTLVWPAGAGALNE